MSPRVPPIHEASAVAFRGRLERVAQALGEAATAAGRDAAEVKLELAVKTQTVEDAAVAATVMAQLGMSVILGHNRVQELTAMASSWPEWAPPVHWHLIGHLQSNKINQVLPTGAVIETLDTAELAQALNLRAGRHLVGGAKQQVYIQVNTSGEQTKSGCAPGQAADLAALVATLEHLELAGLMTIGAHSPDPQTIRASFDRLAGLASELTLPGGHALELSMGMSADYALAIAAGASIVRLGTAVFGSR